ncbi:hypothetical protein Q8F55_003651 [Vanrija albida]|uniref:GmrSD restriction endonucleases N-terminal domain-containing protein n=1 Tax=Vanrija albida TaxID=181172 RepID=A0ABR3Q4T7_9TREE
MSRTNRRDAENQNLCDLDDNELDEILSDDDDDEDVKPDGKKLDAATVLKGQLSEPRFKTVNLRQLYELIEFGQVQLSPEYQRDVVWSQTKMVGLIQSLFFNYYVPPVIFAIQDNEDGEEIRVCIDGKQRCTSILQFMKGQIPFKGANGEKFWYAKYGTGQKGGQLLPAGLKRKFDNIALQVVEYDNIDSDKQRDIFQRVQLGMALSAPEKLQALGGPWSAWITELQKKYVTTEGALASHLPNFDVSRGKPFQNVCAFVMLAFENKSGLHPTAGTEHNFLLRMDEPERGFKKKVEMALGMFNEIAVEHYETAFGDTDKRVAPVEFQFIAYVIFTKMYTLSLKRIAREISKMRAFVRSQHVDIRANTKVYNTFWEYVDSIPLTKMPGEASAYEEWETEADSAREERRRKKRRREEEEDETYNDMGPSRDRPLVVAGSLRSRQQVEDRKPNLPPVEPIRVPRPPPVSMDAPVQSSYATNGSRNGQHDPNSAAYAEHQSRLYQQQHQRQQFARR